MVWKTLNTVTGPVAEGKKYFRREYYEEKLWTEIKKGNHILLLAPRRLGKSSIVKYMEKNPHKYYVCVYANIQSDKSINEFYKRMCSMVAIGLSNSSKTKQLMKGWMKKWNITSINLEGISIGLKDVDFRSMFFEMLEDIIGIDERVVLFLDEFPDVVSKIAKHYGNEEAENLLDDIRRLRHEKKFKKNFILVLLGSVGLNHIVKKITGRSDKVNDLHRLYLEPLNPTELQGFLDHLTDGASMNLSKEVIEHIESKIVHLIPFYLQILIEACDDILQKVNRTELSNTDVDLAYSNLIKQQDNFKDWDERLNEYFPDKYKYLENILTKCAHQNEITIQQIYDLSVPLDMEDSYKADLDDILIADGYLSEAEDGFYFNSPLLRDWWKKRHPLINK